jgi:hypothetical protein
MSAGLDILDTIMCNNKLSQSSKQYKIPNLAMGRQFHNNPDGIRRHYTDQLNNVWMVELLHKVYK